MQIIYNTAAAIPQPTHRREPESAISFSHHIAKKRQSEVTDTYIIECDDPEYDGLCVMLHTVNEDLAAKLFAGEVDDVEDVYGVVPVQATFDLTKDY